MSGYIKFSKHVMRFTCHEVNTVPGLWIACLLHDKTILDISEHKSEEAARKWCRDYFKKLTISAN